jgi:hypothetical protein
MNAPAPGWHPDPTARHQYRYWDGADWTDDVADGGVTSTDPIRESPPLGSDPTVPTGPTQPTDAAYPTDPTYPVDPTHRYPTAPDPQPYYGGTSQPPPAPAKRRPPTGLIAALAVVAVALIGGLVYFVTRDDDDSADDGNDANDANTTLPEDLDDIDSEDTNALVDLMADNMEQAAGGALTHDEAVCISEGMLDELGLSGIMDIEQSDENPFTDAELTSQLFGIMEDCGVSLEDLASAN